MPNGSPAPFTWNEWAKEISEKLDDLIIEFKVHKTKMELKSGIWGIIGGAVSVLSYIIIKSL